MRSPPNQKKKAAPAENCCGSPRICWPRMWGEERPYVPGELRRSKALAGRKSLPAEEELLTRAQKATQKGEKKAPWKMDEISRGGMDRLNQTYRGKVYLASRLERDRTGGNGKRKSMKHLQG